MSSPNICLLNILSQYLSGCESMFLKDLQYVAIVEKKKKKIVENGKLILRVSKKLKKEKKRIILRLNSALIAIRVFDNGLLRHSLATLEGE